MGTEEKVMIMREDHKEEEGPPAGPPAGAQALMIRTETEAMAVRLTGTVKHLRSLGMMFR